MNYLNLETNQLRSPEFALATPNQRGVWLSLMLHCVSDENSGTIKDAASLSGRQWTLLCGITPREVKTECSLWSWDGPDLTVWNYPLGKEIQVKAGREGGKKGGRPTPPPNNPFENPCPNPTHNPTPNPNASPTGTPSRNPSITQKERERKGKGNREGEREDTPAPDLASGEGPSPTSGIPAHLQTALDWAAQFNLGNAYGLTITPATVHTWWDHRTATGWLKSTQNAEIPIVDWQADLRTWARKEPTFATSKTPSEKKEGRGAAHWEVKQQAMEDELATLQFITPRPNPEWPWRQIAIDLFGYEWVAASHVPTDNWTAIEREWTSRNMNPTKATA
jgi:hypothetical protein